ncbi:FtsX-like permease family protein [Actinoplanes sp. NPDC020271]|uniref:FtsX-like permease family protein n=1 Tax=Actinoplanes sp. NPDC020271 TaxID=3363896 RepID=UPI0037AA8C16
MRAGTLVRLSLAGNRTDRMRTALTAGSAALGAVALLAAATVASIHGGASIDAPTGLRTLSPGSDQYASALLVEQGLRPGVIFALIMLALPVLALAGQCIRLGAPARDRRLAALRLAGATPGQTVVIAGAETAAAGLLGSIAGFGVYLVLRVVLDRRNGDGKLLLPTDVRPNTLILIVALLIVPVLAGLIGLLLMRRVVITPLGVVRRLREDGPQPWPGVLIVLGLVLFAPRTLQKILHLAPEGGRLPDWLPLLLMGVGVLLVMIGVVAGTGWISYTAGRLLRRYGRGPVALLSGARLMADPWNGSRTIGALLAAVVFGAGTLGLRADLATDFAAQRRFDELIDPASAALNSAQDTAFYFGAIRLVMVAVTIALVVAAGGVLVALAEGIVARRRTFAAMTAGGVPQAKLGATLFVVTFVPLLPALLLALVCGVSLMRSMRTEVVVTDDTLTLALPIPVPIGSLALLGAGAVLAMLLVVGAGMLVLRSSTDLEEMRAS